MNYRIFSTFLSLLFCFYAHAMMRALDTAASGMASQEQLVNSISHNIANANTTGFKRGRAETEDLLYETVIGPGAQSQLDARYSVGLQIGSGSKVVAVRKEFAEGPPRVTQRPWDLMIRGEGFFGIMSPQGRMAYTRDGSFNVNHQGLLVNKSGYKVFPEIQLPPNTFSVNVSQSGDVEAYVSQQKAPLKVGTIPVFLFINPSGLKSVAGNLLEETLASGQAVQMVASMENAGSIVQGSLEMSNVSVMTEMTNLIKAQRSYEMNSKVMGVADQMLQTVNNIR